VAGPSSRLLVVRVLPYARCFVLRCLLPIIAAIAVVSASVMTWAAAGVVGDTSCCCPVKARCKCHDHDREPSQTPILETCKGDGKLVSPAVAHAVAVAPLEVCVELPLAMAAEPARPRIPEDRSIEPETPPF